MANTVGTFLFQWKHCESRRRREPQHYEAIWERGWREFCSHPSGGFPPHPHYHPCLPSLPSAPLILLQTNLQIKSFCTMMVCCKAAQGCLPLPIPRGSSIPTQSPLRPADPTDKPAPAPSPPLPPPQLQKNGGQQGSSSPPQGMGNWRGNRQGHELAPQQRLHTKYYSVLELPGITHTQNSSAPVVLIYCPSLHVYRHAAAEAGNLRKSEMSQKASAQGSKRACLASPISSICLIYSVLPLIYFTGHQMTGWLPQASVSLCPSLSPLTFTFLLRMSPFSLSINPPFLLLHLCLHNQIPPVVGVHISHG